MVTPPALLASPACPTLPPRLLLPSVPLPCCPVPLHVPDALPAPWGLCPDVPMCPLYQQPLVPPSTPGTCTGPLGTASGGDQGAVSQPALCRGDGDSAHVLVAEVKPCPVLSPVPTSPHAGDTSTVTLSPLQSLGIDGSIDWELGVASVPAGTGGWRRRPEPRARGWRGRARAGAGGRVTALSPRDRPAGVCKLRAGHLRRAVPAGAERRLARRLLQVGPGGVAPR